MSSSEAPGSGPYKTEKRLVTAAKTKADFKKTSNITPPVGYTHIPVGTADLYEHCKTLSEARGYDVYFVSKPSHVKEARDPEKLSYHIARIGYHIRTDVLEEACEALGYTVYHGRFIQEKGVQERRLEGLLAATLSKHGLSTPQETPEQVRATFKELFPKIPDDDLEAIIKMAWEKGANKVGTSTDLDLPSRVQLATLARIRHTYTDYDRLLRPLGYFGSRDEVQADSLRVLLEWRGEKADDEQFEELVREIIVLDDDNTNKGMQGAISGPPHSANDDAQQVADRNGLTANELSVKEKILAVRRNLHAGAQQMRRRDDRTPQQIIPVHINSPHHSMYDTTPPPYRTHTMPPTPHIHTINTPIQPVQPGQHEAEHQVQQVQHVYAPLNAKEILVNGQVYRRIPPGDPSPLRDHESVARRRREHPPTFPSGNYNQNPLQDRPVQSIEYPAAPYVQPNLPPKVEVQAPSVQPNLPARAEVQAPSVQPNLPGSRKRKRQYYQRPERDDFATQWRNLDWGSGFGAQGSAAVYPTQQYQTVVDPYAGTQAPLPPPPGWAAAPADPNGMPAPPAYDPTQPMLNYDDIPDTTTDAATDQPTHGSVAPTQPWPRW